MASVTLRGLSKNFGELAALASLDLTIADGEFLTLLGPSGCGKSTALACIAGLERPSGGTVMFDANPVTDLEPHQRNVAMVFQDYALYPHMTVRENMSFGLRQHRLDNAAIVRQVDAAAAMLGLGPLLDRRPAELSGGQRQRVAVGRAVVRNPAVFLMDEPLSNLDAGLRVKTRTEIKQLQRDLGVTSIFVTHDQEEAMVLSDRIAVMRSGRLQQHGPPMEVYRNPCNLFVASFIGSPAMNITTAEVNFADGALVLRVGDQTMRLPAEVVAAENAAHVRCMSHILLGIRPSDLLVGAERELRLQGRVFLVEPVGPVTYVDVDVSGWAVKAMADPDVGIAVGDTIALGFSPGRVRLFDPTSEARLRGDVTGQAARGGDDARSERERSTHLSG
jgi:ABC-type sugar transport system ATPase subunit